MATVIASPETLDRVIRNIANHAEILNNTTITDAQYQERVDGFVEAVTEAASQHRNWNPEMNSIDGMIDYDMDDELPVGYRQPAVDRNDYTGFESCVEELFYYTSIVKLKAFKLEDADLISKMFNEAGSLNSYSTEWDVDHGVFRN